MNVFELSAKIVADATGFKQGLDASEKSMTDFSEKASKALEKLKTLFIGVVSVAAVKKITSGIFSLANATSQLGDRVDKQSQALGMSRKGFQEWDYILGQSGASIDSMGASMRTLNQIITSGGGDASKTLQELGLSVQEMAGMSQEQAFEATVKALQKLPPGAQKSALAMKLLGRGAQSLMPLLNSSAESVDELRKRAQELGLVMSDEAVDASVAFGDALDDLKRTFTGIKNVVGAKVMPLLTDGLIAVTNYAGKLHGYVQTAIDTGDWKGLFKNIGGDIKEAATHLWTLVTDTVPILWQNAQQALLESDSPFLNIIGELMGGISEAVQYVIDNKATFETVFKTVSDTVSSIVTTGIETVKSIFEWFNENGVSTATIIEGIIAAFATVKIAGFLADLNPIYLLFVAIAGVATYLITNWETVGPFFEGLWEAVKIAVSSAWESTEKFFTGIWEALVLAWNGVGEFFSGLWAGVKSAVSLAWDAVKEWFGNIYTIISAAWDGVVTFFEGLWGSVSNAISKAWSAVNNWLDENTPQALKDIWEGVKKFFATIFNTIRTVVVRAWSAVKNWWETNVADKLSEAWGTIKKFFTDIWDGVKTSISGAWNAVKYWWETDIIGSLKAAWSTIEDYIVGIWNGIRQGIQRAIDAVREFLGLNDKAKYTKIDGVTLFDPENPEISAASAEAESAGRERYGNDFIGPFAAPHANGLSFVPENGYLAELHFGEAVLSRNEAQKWRDGQSSGGGEVNLSSLTNAIVAAVKAGMESANIQMDGESVTRYVSRRQAEDVMARRFAT